MIAVSRYRSSSSSHVMAQVVPEMGRTPLLLTTACFLYWHRRAVKAPPSSRVTCVSTTPSTVLPAELLSEALYASLTLERSRSPAPTMPTAGLAAVSGALAVVAISPTVIGDDCSANAADVMIVAIGAVAVATKVPTEKVATS